MFLACDFFHELNWELVREHLASQLWEMLPKLFTLSLSLPGYWGALHDWGHGGGERTAARALIGHQNHVDPTSHRVHQEVHPWAALGTWPVDAPSCHRVIPYAPYTSSTQPPTLQPFPCMCPRGWQVKSFADKPIVAESWWDSVWLRESTAAWGFSITQGKTDGSEGVSTQPGFAG